MKQICDHAKVTTLDAHLPQKHGVYSNDSSGRIFSFGADLGNPYPNPNPNPTYIKCIGLRYFVGRYGAP